MTAADLNWDAVIAKAMEQQSDPMVLDTTPAMFYHAVVTVERGDLTREQALIALSLHLAAVVQAQHKQLMDWINTSPRAPYLMKAQKVARGDG